MTNDSFPIYINLIFRNSIILKKFRKWSAWPN